MREILVMLLPRLNPLSFLEHIEQGKLIIPLMSDVEQHARDFDQLFALEIGLGARCGEN